MRLLKAGGEKRAERRRLGIPEPDEDEAELTRLQAENKMLQAYIVQLEDMIDDCVGVIDAMGYAAHGEKLLLEVRKRVEARKAAALLASLPADSAAPDDSESEGK